MFYINVFMKQMNYSVFNPFGSHCTSKAQIIGKKKRIYQETKYFKCYVSPLEAAVAQVAVIQKVTVGEQLPIVLSAN